MSPIARLRALRAAKHELPWSEEFLAGAKQHVEAVRVKTRRKRLRARFAPRASQAQS